MNVICVDDEFLSMRRILSMCLDMPEVSHAEGFTSAAKALSWLKDHTADVALLDIHMPVSAAPIRRLYLLPRIPNMPSTRSRCMSPGIS